MFSQLGGTLGQWVCFGGQGVIAENVRDEQRKFIKYNHLIASPRKTGRKAEKAKERQEASVAAR